MGQYRTIVADPPWKYTQKPTERTGGGITAEHQYPTMTTEQIAGLNVPGLAADDAHLYMWVTNPVMLGMRPTIMGRLSAPDLVRAWGFEPKALITWVKTSKATGNATRGGMGWYYRGATEHVIFATRGNAPIPAAVREPNVFQAIKGRHSAKPPEFMEIVERVSPMPGVELFARAPRAGWDVWGNEVESGVTLG